MWIEIDSCNHHMHRDHVTACEGCVDWNPERSKKEMEKMKVTACEGCVDWNWWNCQEMKGGLCHSLRGLCGLKLICAVWTIEAMQSQPARAVWIEMALAAPSTVRTATSQPARAVWIEIVTPAISSNRIILSQSAKAGWFYLAQAAKLRICSKDILNEKFFIFRSERCRKVSIIQDST